MITIVLVSVAGLGVLATALLRACQRSLLRSAPVPGPSRPQGVSILKPMKGVDENLEANLRTFFEQDYPDYEVVLGVRDADDPALTVARAVAAEYPGVRSRIVVDPHDLGANPKVNNLANLARRARHEVFLVSDSNIAVRPGYVTDLVSRLAPDVGLVSSPIRGVGGRGAAGAIEALQLNTFVVGGVAAMDRILHRPCTVGKSMLFRRSDLAAIGGFAFLSAFLAEDQVSGDEIHARGRKVVVTAEPVDNVLGRVGLRAFAARHVRWAKMRRRVSPAGYVTELVLLNPVPFAVAAAIASPAPVVLAFAAAAVFGVAALAASSERSLGVRRPLAAYPALVVARGLVLAALWPIPWFTDRVSWRGNHFRIGPRTRLLPRNEASLTVTDVSKRAAVRPA